MPHRLVRLAVMACLLGAVTPSPKGDGGHAARSDGKRTAPSSPRKREGASHPTVPRSRLHATTQPVAATPSRPSVQSGRAKAEAGAGAGAKAKAASLGAPTEDADLSSSERAALIGGLLLAPAGIGGFLLGCSLGGGGVLLYEKVSKGVQDALSEFKAKHQHEIEGGFRSFEQYAQLTEITVKAPSEELALAYKARLTDVLSQPHNRRCFDCSHCEDEMAVWASINLGVFVCERCAGMHRALGTHKSRIKSAYADVWTVEMIEVRRAPAGPLAGGGKGWPDVPRGVCVRHSTAPPTARARAAARHASRVTLMRVTVTPSHMPRGDRCPARARARRRLPPPAPMPCAAHGGAGQRASARAVRRSRPRARLQRR